MNMELLNAVQPNLQGLHRAKSTPMVRFPNRTGFYTENLKVSKLLQSRRDGMFVEKPMVKQTTTPFQQR